MLREDDDMIKVVKVLITTHVCRDAMPGAWLSGIVSAGVLSRDAVHTTQVPKSLV